MHTINLSQEHQYHLIEALAYSLADKKSTVIQDWTKIPEIEAQYVDAAEKLLYPIKIHRRDKSIATWLKDQFLHSTGIADTEFMIRAIAICDAMAENRYDKFCRQPPSLEE